MYDTGRLYEVQETGRAKIGDKIPIRIIDAGAPSIIIYGSEQKPVNVAAMADIASDVSPFIVADWYDFDALPKYIAFIGTADDIEVSNVRLVDLSAIS